MSSRSKSLQLNMVTGLLQELVAVICGLILPRVILTYFGSTYNGIVNSITQFMAFSIVFRSGLSAVTNAALFKPLAERDNATISGIMVATKDFMNKVGWLLAVCIVGVAVIYPLIVVEGFDYWFSFSLVLIIGASAFVENMFSIKYKILLQADQKYYVQTVFGVIARILSTVFSVVLIIAGMGIHIVKLGSVVGMLSTPFMLKLYVDRHYTIDWKAESNTIAIKSRWDAFAQQLAQVVNNNVATIIMTFFVSLNEISVYSVYYMVTRNVTNLFSSIFNGAKATFGNMIARGEQENLQKRFKDVEFLTYTSSTILFVTTAILITPFVLVYTKNVNDVNYNRYWLGVVISLVSMAMAVRLPYQMLVEAAGIFKETRNGAFLEIALNVLISIALVKPCGLMGVVLGGFAATIVRTTQFAVISYKKVLKCSAADVIKNYLLCFLMSVALVLLSNVIDCIQCATFWEWIVLAIAVLASVTGAVLAISLIFRYERCKSVAQYLFRRKWCVQ